MVQSLGEFWGRRVAERREALGLTQAQLADLCNVTQQSISRIESGAVIPRDSLKMTLSSQLGTNPGELFVWPARSAA